jgi:hypothetical protein
MPRFDQPIEPMTLCPKPLRAALGFSSARPPTGAGAPSGASPPPPRAFCGPLFDCPRPEDARHRAVRAAGADAGIGRAVMAR